MQLPSTNAVTNGVNTVVSGGFPLHKGLTRCFGLTQEAIKSFLLLLRQIAARQ